MAIERLTLPEAVPLWGASNPLKAADRSMEKYPELIEVLSPGEYDVASGVKWSRGILLNLVVFDNGQGLFRMGNDEEVMSKTLCMPDGRVITDAKQHGIMNMIRLPSDTLRIPVVGTVSKQSAPLNLLEIIRWQPNDITELGLQAGADQALPMQENMLVSLR